MKGEGDVMFVDSNYKKKFGCPLFQNLFKLYFPVLCSPSQNFRSGPPLRLYFLVLYCSPSQIFRPGSTFFRRSSQGLGFPVYTFQENPYLRDTNPAVVRSQTRNDSLELS